MIQSPTALSRVDFPEPSQALQSRSRSQDQSPDTAAVDIPPSIVKTEPVMKAESSEARNSATSAMSSGCAMRHQRPEIDRPMA